MLYVHSLSPAAKNEIIDVLKSKTFKRNILSTVCAGISNGQWQSIHPFHVDSLMDCIPTNLGKHFCKNLHARKNQLKPIELLYTECFIEYALILQLLYLVM